MAGLRTFLQVMAQRKVIPESEFLDYHESIEKYIEPGLPSEADALMAVLNKRLKCMDLQIRGVCLGGERLFALINLVNDEVAKNEGSALDASQVEALKKIVAHLAESVNNTASLHDLERGRLPADKFLELVDQLCQAKWLAKDDADNVTYGPRSFLELSENLRDAGVEIPQIIHL